jgi:hypothetical protein
MSWRPAVFVTLLGGTCLAACGGSTVASSHHPRPTRVTAGTARSRPTSTPASTATSTAPTTTSAPVTTTTTTPAVTSTTAPAPPPAAPPPTGPLTSPPLPPPAPGFVAGSVTAVGDSVMIDYQDPLQADIPGLNVQAAVSRQWGDGEAILSQLKAAGQLGAVVIVALGTNGPIGPSDFDAMMGVLSGASRIVFVNVHVDQPWQDTNNAVLAAGVARYPQAVLVDWATLAAAHPEWFGPDGTHLAIDGPGAQALAALIASKV